MAIFDTNVLKDIFNAEQCWNRDIKPHIDGTLHESPSDILEHVINQHGTMIIPREVYNEMMCTREGYLDMYRTEQSSTGYDINTNISNPLSADTTEFAQFINKHRAKGDLRVYGEMRQMFDEEDMNRPRKGIIIVNTNAQKGVASAITEEGFKTITYRDAPANSANIINRGASNWGKGDNAIIKLLNRMAKELNPGIMPVFTADTALRERLLQTSRQNSREHRNTTFTVGTRNLVHTIKDRIFLSNLTKEVVLHGSRRDSEDLAATYDTNTQSCTYNTRERKKPALLSVGSHKTEGAVTNKHAPFRKNGILLGKWFDATSAEQKPETELASASGVGIC